MKEKINFNFEATDEQMKEIKNEDSKLDHALHEVPKIFKSYDNELANKVGVGINNSIEELENMFKSKQDEFDMTKRLLIDLQHDFSLGLDPQPLRHFDRDRQDYESLLIDYKRLTKELKVLENKKSKILNYRNN